MRRVAPVAGLLLSVLLTTACDSADADDDSLTTADRAAIESLKQRYVSSWLRDDTAAGLATFTQDGMLLPPGQRPVQGEAAIKAHWWPPDGSHTVITAFTLTADELEGAGSLAYSRGVSTLSWSYTPKDGATQSQSGRNISLTIFRKTTAGWRIARQMWGPSLPP